jgi:hypothetical protein
MEHVRNPLHGFADNIAIGNASLHDFNPCIRLQEPVVTQSTNAYMAVVVRPENSVDEMATYFASRAGDQDASGKVRA